MEQNEEMLIYKRATFGKRFGALVIDIIILYVLGKGLEFITGKPTAPTQEELIGLPLSEIMLVSMSANMMSYYISLSYSLLEIFTQKSIGKMILGLVIADRDGYKAPIVALLIRYLLKQMGTILFVIALLGHIDGLIWAGSLLGFIYFIGCFMATSENRLALHDLIAKTAVYDEKQLAEE